MEPENRGRFMPGNKAARGRPKGDPQKVKSVCMTFNVTPRDADILIRAAMEHRMSVGAYLRYRVLRGKRNEAVRENGALLDGEQN